MKIGDKVVCVALPTRVKDGRPIQIGIKIGEIYRVCAIKDDAWYECGLAIKISHIHWYSAHLFRPVDETFGEVVCESLEQLIEVEKYEAVK